MDKDQRNMMNKIGGAFEFQKLMKTMRCRVCQTIARCRCNNFVMIGFRHRAGLPDAACNLFEDYLSDVSPCQGVLAFADVPVALHIPAYFAVISLTTSTNIISVSFV